MTSTQNFYVRIFFNPLKSKEICMSGSVNKVTIIGNLGRDPEVRRTANGDPVVSMSIATTESWRDKESGERRDRTEWHNVVIFNEMLAGVAEKLCKKGSKIYIEGQLQTRQYVDKNGDERRVTEVVLQKYRGELTVLSGKKSDDTDATETDGGRSTTAKTSSKGTKGGKASKEPVHMDEDHMPF